MSAPGLDLGRRGSSLRRLFFWPVLLLAAPGLAAPPNGQDAPPSARIGRRQVRLIRDASGDYRVVEAFELSILDESVRAGLLLADPLPAIRLQPEAQNVMRVGGDVGPDQVRYEPPQLTVFGPIPAPTFQVVITYRLPADATRLEIVGEWPTDELTVEIARGNVEARVDGALELAGRSAPPSRPTLKYAGGDIEARRVVLIRFPTRAVGWRDRLAVLLATGLAAGAALFWAARRAPPT